MKNPVAHILTAAICLIITAPLAHALTPQELAGTYSGYITDTFSNGRTVTATETVIYKKNGKGISQGLYQGQTFKSKGTYAILSDTTYSEHSTDAGASAPDAVGYYKYANGVFTTVVLNYDFASGGFVVRKAVLTRIK